MTILKGVNVDLRQKHPKKTKALPRQSKDALRGFSTHRHFKIQPHV